MQETDTQYQNVYEQLKIDEGVKYEIYEDHLGYPTFGVGHLIIEDDPEYGQTNPTEVSEERVMECFLNDLQIQTMSVGGLYGADFWCDFPQEVREILLNMMFNM